MKTVLVFLVSFLIGISNAGIYHHNSYSHAEPHLVKVVHVHETAPHHHHHHHPQEFQKIVKVIHVPVPQPPQKIIKVIHKHHVPVHHHHPPPQIVKIIKEHVPVPQPPPVFIKVLHEQQSHGWAPQTGWAQSGWRPHGGWA